MSGVAGSEDLLPDQSQPEQTPLPAHTARPLAAVASLYAVGILLGKLVPLPLAPLLGLLIALLLAATTWRTLRSVLFACLFLLAGQANMAWRTSAISPRDLRVLLGRHAAIVTVRGKLLETPSLRVYERGEKEMWRTLARVKVLALCPNRGPWQPAAGTLAISSPGPLTNLFAGLSVEVTGVADLPPNATAEGTFDYRAVLKHQGIYYLLHTQNDADWQVISSPTRPPWSERFRQWGRAALARGLPCEDESLRLEWALTLAWKTALTEEVSEPFVQAATFHIFAVDGLRMAIIFGILFGLLRALSLPRPICGAVLLPIIWFYVALTGWPASAIRATVMLSIVILGWLLKRPGDLLNSLFAAALVILIWEPRQLFQAGFQLSFFVVLTMLLMLPPMHRFFEKLTAPDPLLPAALYPAWRQRWHRPLRYLTELFLTSLAAWLGSLPLVAYYFHILTPVSTPANLLAVPLCGLVLMSNLASLLVAGVLPAFSVLFNHAGWFLMECIRVGSVWFAHWPHAFIYVPAPAPFTSALYYALLLAGCSGWIFRKRFRSLRLAGTAALVAAWATIHGYNASLPRLSILPLSGGHALFYEAPAAGHGLLVDCGTTNSVEYPLKPFLRAQGVNRLPALVLTHGDVHHVGGAEALDHLFPIDHVYASPLRFRSVAYRQSVAFFTNAPARLKSLSQGEAVSNWEVLHPAGSDRFSRADDGALVLAADFSGIRVLLLSDLGRAGQDALLARCPQLRADIVITGLPANGEPVCDALLESLAPRLLVVCDSEFPAPARAPLPLVARLNRHPQTQVLYTRRTGALTFTFHRRGWITSAMNSDDDG